MRILFSLVLYRDFVWKNKLFLPPPVCGEGARRMTPNHIDIGQNTFEKFKFKEFTLSLTIGSITHTVKPPYRSFPPPPPPLKTADDPHGHSATLMTPPLCANSIISSLPMTEESGLTTKHWRWLHLTSCALRLGFKSVASLSLVHRVEALHAEYTTS